MQEQYKPKMFRVNYQTEHGEGCIVVKDALWSMSAIFFGKNSLKDANEFLRFARTHCTREQQLALLAMLEEEKLLYRDIDTRRERIEKTIKKIEAQTWGQSNTGKSRKAGKTGKVGNARKLNRA